MSSRSIQSFLDAFSRSLSDVLSQALAMTWSASRSEQMPSADTVCTRFIAASPRRGDVSLFMPRTDAVAVAELFLGNSDVSGAEWTADRKEAFEELARQIVGHLQTAIKSEFGEVSLKFVPDDVQDPKSERFTYEAVCEGKSPLLFQLALTPDLIETLIGSRDNLELAENMKKPEPSERNLELLMDVELAATLRFGQKRLLLREILELSSGAVVELDRQVHEPVELLVDDRTIARGELVVVDGNYGLRVSEVVTPQQRADLIH
jgi:flagellar motor switch protein FliN/FliY